MRVKILSVTEAERTAEVTIESSFRKDGKVSTYADVVTLVEEDGNWRICGAREGAGHD